jgi:elongation factor G
MATPNPATTNLETQQIRNIGVLAHVDAGKTSITEKMLHLAGLKREAGDVDEGTTSTDYLSVERLHGITVKSAAVRFQWGNAFIHLIDTPGHVDFGNEVDRALRILDGAVIALCAVSGVQARTEVIAKACDARNLPRLYFVNKMDRAGADFFGIVEDLSANLEPNALALQFPLYEGQRWIGIVDLLTMKAFYLHTEHPDNEQLGGSQGASGTPIIASALPEHQRTALKKARARLFEKLAEGDEEVLSYFATDHEAPQALLAKAAAEALQACRLVPLFCGSAFVDVSVRLLLDAVENLLPSPAKALIPEGIDPKTGEEKRLLLDPAAPAAAFVFKTLKDSLGELYAWARIWTGMLHANKKLLDARSGKNILVKRLFGIHADSLIELKEAGPGEIVAIKASDIEPGASLCDPKNPILFEALDIPIPVLSQVFEPATLRDLHSLRSALESLALEDLSLKVQEEKETGRFEVAGQGELHLEILAERLKREFGLTVRTGNPKVQLKERLVKNATVAENFDRDLGGERVRVSVEVSVQSKRDRPGVELLQNPSLRAQPQYLAAAKRGAAAALAVGPSQGYPLEGAELTLINLSPPASQTGKNGEIALEAAAALATRKALLEAGSEILEPVMRIDIDCPDEHFGPVLNSISTRGGRVESVEESVGSKSIVAQAPMSRLFGFASELRSMSKGRAQFQARFAGYEATKAL